MLEDDQYFKMGVFQRAGSNIMEGDWTPLPTMMIPKRKFLFVLSFYPYTRIKKRNHFKTNPKSDYGKDLETLLLTTRNSHCKKTEVFHYGFLQ